MKRVYVTESGYFDKYGLFHVTNVIGVDKMLRLAVAYPVSLGCYHHHVEVDDISLVVVYKQQCSDRGYRVTAIDLY